MQQGKTPVQRQNNPYAKPIGDTCYRCNGRGHKSNVCPTRRVTTVAKEKEEERERPDAENEKYVGVDFAEEESDERVNFVLQRILLLTKDEG